MSLRPLLANLVYGPSCVSLDSALAFHGLLLDRDDVVTSVTPKRQRSFSTPVGSFVYRQAPPALAGRAAAGRFRGDLYGRLAGLVLDLPPLRERRADLGILVEMLWQRGGGDAADCSEVFTPELHAALRELRWSLNVRGLRHLVDRTLLLSRRYGAAAARAAVLKDAADCELRRTPGPRRKRPIDPAHARQGEWDADLLRDALEVSGGVIPEAARLLGLSRAHAYRLYARLRSGADVASPE